MSLQTTLNKLPAAHRRRPEYIDDFATVSVIGLGYIGLPTAVAFAAAGRTVIGVDIDRNVVDTLNRGGICIVEPDLDLAVKRAVEGGGLRGVLEPEPADAFLIAVPTPFKSEHQPDLRFVKAAAAAIAPVLQPGNLVVLESTSPVGATEQLAQWLEDARPDLRFPQEHGAQANINIAYCPERVLPGQVMRELVENDRVIGGITPRCSQRASLLYGAFVKGECVVTTARAAEMCKLTENAFRDVNIAFANELSLICDHIDVNVWELIRLANRHPRVNILQPGPGVGGHCIAVDPWFIVDSAPEQARLIRTAREVNDGKPEWVLQKIEEAVAQWQAQGVAEHQQVIALFGLSFKPDIDDLRESPALEIAATLARSSGARILAVEPHINVLPASLAGSIELVDACKALELAHVAVMLVSHSAFAALPPPRLPMRVVDTRGVWSA